MIGILTGTFDPVHDGHIAVAQEALKQCNLEAVWFWPNPDPAHKMTVAGLAERLAMIELNLQGYDSLKLAPLTMEELKGFHSLDHFTTVLHRFREKNFTYILGSDTLARLHTWNNVESVVRNASYIVVQRPGDHLDGLTDPQHRLGPLARELTTQVIIAPRAHGISSTALRQKLALGQVGEGLAPVVAEYALRQRLYS